MLKILVPCDGSANSLRAVRYAADLAKKLPDLQLHLLYVEDPVMMRECAHRTPDEQQKIQVADADRVLHEARKLLASEKVRFQECIRTGPPANEIALYARESGCDGIIMGTRGLGPIASVLLGSVASQTIHLTDIPVTLIK